MIICVDASLVIKWLTPEEGSQQALKLYQKWMKQDCRLIAPYLIEYEIASTFRQKIIRGMINTEELFLIFNFYKKLGIELFHPDGFLADAVALAAALSQPTAYDVSYLLLAKSYKANFVTADKRFCLASSDVFSCVKFYKDLMN